METLKSLRQKTGITQASLATKLVAVRGGKGLQCSIANLEKGNTSPTIDRLNDIVEALGYRLRIRVEKRGERLDLDIGSLLGKGAVLPPGPASPPGSASPPSPGSASPPGSALTATRAKDTREGNTDQTIESPPDRQPEANADNQDQSLQSLLTDILTK